MKITGQDPAKTAELTLAKNAGKDKAAPAKQGKSESESARVQTRASLTMDKIKDSIRQEPDVRADRVAELREKIESGEYRIDSKKLADKILVDSLREDLEKP